MSCKTPWMFAATVRRSPILRTWVARFVYLMFILTVNCNRQALSLNCLQPIQRLTGTKG